MPDEAGYARRGAQIKWLEQGRQARRAGDAYAALAAFAKARQLQPDDAEITQALADALVDVGAPKARTAADAVSEKFLDSMTMR